MSKIRVLIVEDSAVVRGLLEHIISSDDRLEVAAMVNSGEQALTMLTSVTPDVIVMDVGLPGIDGLETTRRIMTKMPIPVVIVTATISRSEALSSGALTVLEKPAGYGSLDYARLSETLCTQLVIMSQVRLVRHHGRVRTAAPRPPEFHGYSMLGIACSTGGPPALVTLLNGLGPDFPLPILVVQHMSAGFMEGFANWLDGVCPFTVRIAEDGSAPQAHTVHIAPTDRHLKLSKDGSILQYDSSAAICSQRPSGTVLFQSMAQGLGHTAIGVVLTGMGQDGAIGLYEMRRAGGHTIAQDKATSAVYGMPEAAVAMGAATETLALEEIAPRLLKLVPARKAVFE